MSTLIKDKTTNEWKTVNGVYISMPVGAVTAFMGTTAPAGWLICDGSTFNESEFPSLRDVLGSNVLPDLRECALVGAGQNATHSIAAHDEYTIGEFKDDCFQGHTHLSASISFWTDNGGDLNPSASSVSYGYKSPVATDDVHGTPRVGNSTHGKQVGVNYIIKAV